MEERDRLILDILPSLVKMAKHLLGQNGKATIDREDLVQAGVVKIIEMYNCKDEHPEIKNLGGYLTLCGYYQMANTLRNNVFGRHILRMTKNHLSDMASVDAEGNTMPYEPIDKEEDNRQSNIVVNDLLNVLDDKERKMLFSFVYEGREKTDIARKYGYDRNNTRRTINRAFRKLKEVV